MPTSISPLTAENMIKANSGAYYLLHQDGGYTGSLNLTGPARIDNLNAGNAYVAGTLNVTGNQANFGNTTGFNFNHLARIVNTGDAYLKSVTGVATFNEIVATGRTRIDQIYNGLKVSGNLSLIGNSNIAGNLNITGISNFVGDLNSTGEISHLGDLNISGNLYVNGQQITGGALINQELVLTGNYTSLYVRKGDILVGTGNSGVSILPTGSAHGKVLKVDTGSIYGLSYGDSVGEIFYERSFDLPLTEGTSHQILIPFRAGRVTRIEGEVSHRGDTSVVLSLTKGAGGGSSLGSNLTIGTTYGATQAHGVQSYSSAVSAYQELKFLVVDDGASSGSGGIQATGQLRLGVSFILD